MINVYRVEYREWNSNFLCTYVYSRNISAATERGAVRKLRLALPDAKVEINSVTKIARVDY